MDMMNHSCLNCREGWYEESSETNARDNLMQCVVCGHKIDRYSGESDNSSNFNKKLYLAGPFFNPAQIELLEKVESICEKYNVPYFSPRKDADCDPEVDGDAGIFQADVEGMHSCGAVLACMDWKLPYGEILATCNEQEFRDDDGGMTCYVAKNDVDLNIPDPGTVWECGYAKGKNIPTFIYTTNPAPIMNLMIHVPAYGVFKSLEEIEVFIKTWSEATDIKVVDSFRNYIWIGKTQ